MAKHSPRSVGLGGDGDEIDAMEDVERAFGVKLDVAEASKWLTVGDVFASLQRALPALERHQSDLWKRFATALCGQTDVNPDDIEPSSPLLSQCGLWGQVSRASALVWIVAAAAVLALVGWAFF